MTAGNAPSFFAQEMDLVVISSCLTILVGMTVVLEFSVIQLKAYFARNAAITEMVQKVISELMILGFISFTTALVISFNTDAELLQRALAEFELAHIWLFVVGMLYVANAVNMMLNLERIKNSWTAFDDARIQSVNENSPRSPRSRCAWLVCGSGTKAPALAEFKVFKLFFMQQNWKYLEHELGSERHVMHFDYAQYIRTVVTEEIIELLEVRPTTWLFFVVILWLCIAARNLAGLRYDNEITALAVSSAWFLFVFVGALVLEAHRGTLRLHDAIRKSFGLQGEEMPEHGQGWPIEDTFARLSEDGVFRKPSHVLRREREGNGVEAEAGGNGEGDGEGKISPTTGGEGEAASAAMPATPATPATKDDEGKGKKDAFGNASISSSTSSEKGVELASLMLDVVDTVISPRISGDASPPSSSPSSSPSLSRAASPTAALADVTSTAAATTAAASMHDEDVTTNTPQRPRRTRNQITRKTAQHARVRQFSRMTHGDTRKLMLVAPKTMSRFSEIIMFLQCFMLGSLLLISFPEATNRVQHFGLTMPGTSNASSSSSSSASASGRMLLGATGTSATGSAASGPTDATPAWALCQAFDSDPDPSKQALAFYSVTFMGHAPFTDDDAMYTCTVWSDWFGPLLICLALLPQLVVMFWLQPLYVKNYCYFAAVTMGEGKVEESHHTNLSAPAESRAGVATAFEEDERDEHSEHEGHLDAAAFGRILMTVFDRMHEDETVAHLYRTIINSAVRRRAVEKKRKSITSRTRSFYVQMQGMPSTTVEQLASMTEKELNNLAVQFCTEDMYDTERHLLFGEMDVDASGNVGYNQFRAGLDALMKQTGQCPLSTRRFRRLLRLFDRDRSGQINEREFHQFLIEEEYDWPDDIINQHLNSENVKLREHLSQVLQGMSSQTLPEAAAMAFPAGVAAAAVKLSALKKKKKKKKKRHGY